MDVKIQLICILISFLYGLFINITFRLNYKINQNKNILTHIIIDLLYVYIIVLLYTLVIYNINDGIFYIYFLLLILLGYFMYNKCVNFTITILKSIKKKNDK